MIKIKLPVGSNDTSNKNFVQCKNKTALLFNLWKHNYQINICQTFQIKTGDFQNASELGRKALRLHEFYRHRVIEELLAEIAKSWDGDTSKRTASDIAKAKARKGQFPL